ncbi:hypothetical protein F4604DRAFT_1912790 [Suillus subluteus]|nr:hypothetical protein F4604DRAFT_1912790 [Suillus subluteus]
MARTKIQSTGGSARTLTAPLVPATSLIPSTLKRSTMAEPPSALEARDSHSMWCMICRDGGEGTIILYECNACPHVMCSKCIKVPEAFVDAVQRPNIYFFCLGCHSKAALKSPAPFFGFFNDGLPSLGGKAVLPHFLRLNGKYEMASSSIMAATPIVLIHFILVGDGDDTICTPVALISKFLGTFYPNGGFTYVEITFDVTSHDKIDAYNLLQVDRVVQIMQHLGSTGRMVAFFSNHSEQDYGWLYGGQAPKEDGSGLEYVAMEVSHVLTTVFSPYSMVLKNAHVIFLVCGSVVAHHNTYAQLIFFLAFAELVLVEQLCVRVTFPELLALSGRLGLHTKVILMTPDTASPHHQLECTTFARAHTQTQPWGVDVPAQCPQCGSTKSWSEKVALTVRVDSNDSDESSASQPTVTRYVYSCKYTNCGTAQRLPAYKFIIERPPGFMVNSARTTKGGWFQSPSIMYLPSPTKGKRKNQEATSMRSAKKGRK